MQPKDSALQSHSSYLGVKHLLLLLLMLVFKMITPLTIRSRREHMLYFTTSAIAYQFETVLLRPLLRLYSPDKRTSKYGGSKLCHTVAKLLREEVGMGGWAYKVYEFDMRLQLATSFLPTANVVFWVFFNCAHKFFLTLAK